MKHLREWSLFESDSEGLTQRQLAFLEVAVKRWEVDPETGKIDAGLVNASSVYWDGRRDGGRIPVDFGEVRGDFNYNSNGLKSLEGAPRRVGGSVWVTENQLEDLVGGPEVVGGSFSCSQNPLRTLKGSPVEIGGDFACMNTRIESLEGGPEIVGRSYNCQGNPALVSLKGAPKVLGGEFRCGAFTIQKGKWGIEGWMDVLESEDEKTRSLILTLLTPEVLNPLIQKDPEGTMMRLKGVWNRPDFRETRSGLVFPRGYEGEMDLLGTLSDVGL